MSVLASFYEIMILITTDESSWTPEQFYNFIHFPKERRTKREEICGCKSSTVTRPLVRLCQTPHHRWVDDVTEKMTCEPIVSVDEVNQKRTTVKM